ncbi:MAG: type I restriction-modification enzyme R subunit C-terminal domain-containing protein [Terracidiphilus sp.]
MTPEEQARESIDGMLLAAGWLIQDRADANIDAGRGVAIREFALGHGFGEADYLLFADGQAVGVIEAKKEGSTLTGFEIQTQKYSEGIPEALPAPRRPLPYCYESTGIETRFTNLLEPNASSRAVFSFHRPETLSEWLKDELASPGFTFKARLASMPPLVRFGLRPAQVTAIDALEDSLSHGRRRSLVQMASGAGKTYTACNALYRLIKFTGARRVLFLVDRGNLGRQTLKEFQAFRTPDDGRIFTELYNVQHLQSSHIDPVAKVCISTIQRLYSMLKGEELDPEQDELSGSSLEMLQRPPDPIVYNPAIPIETFDLIVTDECHRSIYNLWRQVLEYFDASLIGLTATPSKQTLGFFNQNLIMEYPFERAVADGVNVDFELYTIRTLISEHGSVINAGFQVDYRDRQTRKIRWELADQDIPYDADDLDRRVVAPDQIRTIIRAFRDRLFTDIFPGRTEVPKTLIFAKDDSHAEDIVKILREEFGKGNDFAQKITYRTGAAKVRVKKTDKDGNEYEVDEWVSSNIKPEDLLSQFRTAYNPRIAVTVDMIATGTDIRPLEIVFFMRAVKSRTMFEQMKGRGARIVTPTELQNVTPDGRSKDHFVIIDAVGLEPEKMQDTQPLERKRNVSLEKLFELVTFGNREPDVLSSIAARLARLDRELTPNDRTALTETAKGQSLASIAGDIVQALDPDRHIEAARAAVHLPSDVEPNEEELTQARKLLLNQAAKPLAANPALRNLILGIKKSYEQIIDTVNQDQLLEAGPAEVVRERAVRMVQTFEQFLRDHRDEIEVLQILYSKPYAVGLSLKQVKALANLIEKPIDGSPHLSPDQLWRAYERIDAAHVHGSRTEVAADLVNLVRFALKQKDQLMPRRAEAESRFAAWLQQQQSAGTEFRPDQLRWLEAIRDHIASSLAVEPEDLELDPFSRWGGLGRAQQIFGDRFLPLLNELNEVLAA